MKSLLNEALARHQEAEAKEEREAAKAAKTPEKGKNNDDQEIEKIVESINVSIKIVGCGGGWAAAPVRGLPNTSLGSQKRRAPSRWASSRCRSSRKAGSGWRTPRRAWTNSASSPTPRS